MDETIDNAVEADSAVSSAVSSAQTTNSIEYGYVTITMKRTPLQRIGQYLLKNMNFFFENPTTQSDFVCNFLSDNSIYSNDDMMNDNLDSDPVTVVANPVTNPVTVVANPVTGGKVCSQNRTNTKAYVDYIDFEYNDDMDTCGCPYRIIYHGILYCYKPPTPNADYNILDLFPSFKDQFMSQAVFNKSTILSCFNCIYEYVGHDSSEWDDYMVHRPSTVPNKRTVRATWKSTRSKTILVDDRMSGNVLSIVKLKSSTESDRYMFAYDSMAFTDKKCVMYLLKLLFYSH